MIQVGRFHPLSMPRARTALNITFFTGLLAIL